LVSRRLLRASVSGFVAIVFTATTFTMPARASDLAAVSSGFFATARIVDAGKLPATARGAVTVRIALADSAGKPVGAHHAVRATIVGGDARFGAGAPAAEVATDDNGQIALTISAGTTRGPVTVRLSDADTPSASVPPVDVAVPMGGGIPNPFVVGVATIGAGPVPGWVESPDGAPNGTDTRRAMGSLFADGAIARNTRATFAYNTADTLAQSTVSGPFTDDPNDRPFPIYGDTSTRYDDALSESHLFADVRNGRSDIGWGEFYAQGTSNQNVGGYTTLVNGFHVHAEGNALAVGGFAASNDIAFDRRVITPSGLAIAATPLRPDVVVGSDVLTLVHLDRRTGAVLEQQQLTRGTDYTIDYASGLVRFINIILPYDDAFNPQIVIAQYEYGGGGAHASILGLSGALKLDPAGHTRADTWYLNDTTGGGNFSLLGQALTGKLPGGGWTVSHERSNGELPVAQIAYGDGGDSYRLSLAAQAGSLAAKLLFSSTAAGYENPYGSYASPGFTGLNANVSDRIGAKATLEVGVTTAKNALPALGATTAIANADVQAQAKLTLHPDTRFSYHVGIRDDAATSNGAFTPTFLQTGNTSTGLPPTTFDPTLPAPYAYAAGSGHSLDALYGFRWEFAPRAAFDAERNSPLGGDSADPYDPPSTRAEVTLDLGDATKAFIRELWQRAPLEALAASQQAETYAATASTATSIGIETTAGDTTYESSYAVDHTANGSDLYSAFGARRRVNLSKNLSGDAFVQVGESLLNSDVQQQGSPYFVSYGTSLSYTQAAFHATAQAQIRTGYLGGSTYSLGAAGPISPSWSLFGALTGANTDDVVDDEARIGLSFRPAHNDRYVTLATLDTRHSNLTDYDGYVSNVAQLQELYRPSSHTELAASVAYKITGDAYFAPRTSIYGLRADQRIGPRLDIAAEYHRSDVAPIGDVSATGFALEAGLRLGDSLRVAAGYNFSGFADPAVAVSPTHRGLYVTLSSYIDRIMGWGKENRP
jgi:hypothetical protein